MKTKKLKKSIKTVPSFFLLIGTLWCVCMALGVILFCILYTKYVNDTMNVFGWIIVSVFCGLFPLFIIIMMVRRGLFSIVTIDENGLHRALFGVFLKVSISWEELYEIKCFYRVVPQIFCSKGKLRGLMIDEAIKTRGVIQIPASIKVLAVIRQYTDKEIIGIHEEDVQNMIARYK